MGSIRILIFCLPLLGTTHCEDAGLEPNTGAVSEWKGDQENGINKNLHLKKNWYGEDLVKLLSSISNELSRAKTFWKDFKEESDFDSRLKDINKQVHNNILAFKHLVTLPQTVQPPEDTSSNMGTQSEQIAVPEDTLSDMITQSEQTIEDTRRLDIGEASDSKGESENKNVKKHRNINMGNTKSDEPAFIRQLSNIIEQLSRVKQLRNDFKEEASNFESRLNEINKQVQKNILAFKHPGILPQTVQTVEDTRRLDIGAASDWKGEPEIKNLHLKKHWSINRANMESELVKQLSSINELSRMKQMRKDFKEAASDFESRLKEINKQVQMNILAFKHPGTLPQTEQPPEDTSSDMDTQFDQTIENIRLMEIALAGDAQKFQGSRATIAEHRILVFIIVCVLVVLPVIGILICQVCGYNPVDSSLQNKQWNQASRNTKQQRSSNKQPESRNINHQRSKMEQPPSSNINHQRSNMEQPPSSNINHQRSNVERPASPNIRQERSNRELPASATIINQQRSNTELPSSANISQERSNVERPSSTNISQQRSNMELPASASIIQQRSAMELPASTNISQQKSDMEIPASRNISQQSKKEEEAEEEEDESGTLTEGEQEEDEEYEEKEEEEEAEEKEEVLASANIKQQRSNMEMPASTNISRQGSNMEMPASASIKQERSNMWVSASLNIKQPGSNMEIATSANISQQRSNTELPASRNISQQSKKEEEAEYEVDNEGEDNEEDDSDTATVKEEDEEEEEEKEEEEEEYESDTAVVEEKKEQEKEEEKEEYESDTATVKEEDEEEKEEEKEEYESDTATVKEKEEEEKEEEKEEYESDTATVEEKEEEEKEEEEEEQEEEEVEAKLMCCGKR
ncbi:FK506-binding protein 5-like isoform X3 [Gigantopelta aegis]|uniref:FK506-binding protein 5-like isoform X3 n=1 Tax=Gigantopelta aegis TaxID=1735272 RepID=UPI001B88DC11|nr:FK506-binding protein 5-like isoform X3 [Gigantopelta aegis]